MIVKSLWSETEYQTGKALKLLRKDDCIIFKDKVMKEGYNLSFSHVFSTLPSEKVLEKIEERYPLAQIDFTDMESILLKKDEHDVLMIEKCILNMKVGGNNNV